MFYFRINRLFISDNKENPRYLLFGPDLAQVKIISFVSTENELLPDMSAFIQTNDPAQKRQILKEAVEKVVGSRIYTEIQNVKDHHEMTFGNTGFVLYKSEKIPEDFDWQLIVYESDRKIREHCQLISDIVNDEGFDDFASRLLTLVSGKTNPGLTAAIAIARYAIQITAKEVRENKDDLIGILYTSLNRREHYPHGERKKERVNDLTNNMQIDYSLFGFDE
jgi:hypothetical protein